MIFYSKVHRLFELHYFHSAFKMQRYGCSSLQRMFSPQSFQKKKDCKPLNGETNTSYHNSFMALQTIPVTQNSFTGCVRANFQVDLLPPKTNHNSTSQKEYYNEPKYIQQYNSWKETKWLQEDEKFDVHTLQKRV